MTDTGESHTIGDIYDIIGDRGIDHCPRVEVVGADRWFWRTDIGYDLERQLFIPVPGDGRRRMYYEGETASCAARERTCSIIPRAIHMIDSIRRCNTSLNRCTIRVPMLTNAGNRGIITIGVKHIESELNHIICCQLI